MSCETENSLTQPYTPSRSVNDRAKRLPLQHGRVSAWGLARSWRQSHAGAGRSRRFCCTRAADPSAAANCPSAPAAASQTGQPLPSPAPPLSGWESSPPRTPVPTEHKWHSAEVIDGIWMNKVVSFSWNSGPAGRHLPGLSHLKSCLYSKQNQVTSEIQQNKQLNS